MEGQTPSQKPKQRDITMFTVKQSPIQGLKLTLVRDPRSFSAKIPVKPSPKPAAAIPPPAPSSSSASSSEPQEKPRTVVQIPAKSSSGHSSKKYQPLLPVSRVKMVMKTNVKSSQNSLSGISQESVMVVSKATELFIAQLAKEAYQAAEDQPVKDVSYKHLARAVQRNSDQMRFLFDILPEKVLYRDHLASLGDTHTAKTDSEPN